MTEPTSRAKARRRRIGERLVGLRSFYHSEDDLSAEQKDKLSLWKEDYWAFLTGTDTRDTATLDFPEGKPIIWTKDERDRVNPIKPFPDEEYLHDVLDGIHYGTVEPEGLYFSLHEAHLHAIEKSRQMFISTCLLLYFCWECAFEEARSVLVSKVTEEEAIKLLRDKVRFPYKKWPEWLRRRIKLSEGPRERIDFTPTGSTMTGVAENVAKREARGGTATDVLVDEACYQDELGSILEAAQPMASRIVMVSTPELGAPESGAAIFGGYIRQPMADVYDYTAHLDGKESASKKGKDSRRGGTIRVLHPRQGIEMFYNTQKRCSVYRVHYTASESKQDPRWISGVKSTMPSHAAYRREYELDWSAPGGSPFYPEFAENWKKYIKKAPKPIPQTTIMLRAFDFGYRHPACLWILYYPEVERLHVVRECMPAGMDTHSFRDLIRYLSGDITMEELIALRRPKALEWVQALPNMTQLEEGWRDVPDPPWFEHGQRWHDFSGHEANIMTAHVESEKEERSSARIFEAAGMDLTIQSEPISAGENILRRLLLDTPDGEPGLYIDPACPLFLEGMKGGIRYPKPTKMVPIPTKPMKDEYFEHLHDCARYAATGAVPVAETGEILRPETVYGGETGRTPMVRLPGRDQDQVPFHETVVDKWD